MNNILKTLFASTAILLVGCSTDELVEKPVTELSTHGSSATLEGDFEVYDESEEQDDSSNKDSSLNNNQEEQAETLTAEEDNIELESTKSDKGAIKREVRIGKEFVTEVDDDYTETVNDDGSIHKSSSFNIGEAIEQHALKALEEDATIPIYTPEELTQEIFESHDKFIIKSDDGLTLIEDGEFNISW